MERVLAFNQTIQMDRDETRVNEFYVEDYTSHGSDPSQPGRIFPPSRMAELLAANKVTNPERVITPLKIVCSGDFVTIHALVSENFNSPIAGVEPTGEYFEVTTTNIYRFENGKVAERWGNADMAYIFRQLGFTVTREQP